MKQSEKDILIKYFYHKEQFLENDIVGYGNKYLLRDCDQVDHLESIIAITRKQAFIEFKNDVERLLKLPPYDTMGKDLKK